MKILTNIFPFFRRKTCYKAKTVKTSRRLQILSDLHLEIGQQYASFTVPAAAPYLVLAGDIGRLIDYDALLHGFLARLVPRHERIFYVLGNHEFYGLTYEAGIVAARRLEGEACLEGKLTVLHCDTWEENEKEKDNGREGLREEGGGQQQLTIIGCTLWSDVPEAAQAIVQSKVNDFRKINGWTIAQHNAHHVREAAWLRQAVAATTHREGKQGPLCVVTHHAPSLKGTSNPLHASHPWTPGFATELLGDGSGTWSPAIDLWVFGHTHHCVDDADCHGVHLAANQRGYILPGQILKGSNTNPLLNACVFDPGLVIEL